MENTIQINDLVTVGPHPTLADLEELRIAGFKTIVNFRHDGEDEQPMSPEDEGAYVERLKMVYLHLPVSLKSISPALVNRFRHEMTNIPKPAFAHCKTGRRAGLMVMMHCCSEQRMSGKAALVKIEAMGFKCDTAEMEQFVVDYVESHSHVRA